MSTMYVTIIVNSSGKKERWLRACEDEVNAKEYDAREGDRERVGEGRESNQLKTSLDAWSLLPHCRPFPQAQKLQSRKLLGLASDGGEIKVRPQLLVVIDLRI